ncbi:MAG: TlyA family rRNA (cytidine-2'-O)-methyltransferase [Rhodospirillaceae bacterium]|nr:TlyA family rRNA (cytidine-2'-O)-methyltransferase [Rhodospirillaceae bacterium]
MLVTRGLVDSRAKAAALAMAGKVYSGERKLEKPGTKLNPDTPLSLREAPHPWVSRGGLKLAHGLSHFSLNAAGRVALDIGASTGGFTDVLLQRGAAKIYAVDVGYGQLADKLRKDDRVIVLERTNARNLTREQVPEPAGAIVCDASFIGLRTVLPAALALAGPGAFLLALIKPQFEAGRSRVGKGGIVRDPAVHAEVCDEIRDWLAAQPGWQVQGICDSPITGAEGNKEFLLAGTFAA